MNDPVDTFILAIQNGAEAYASATWAGFKPATQDQVDRLRIAMDHTFDDRERLGHDLRIQMLRAIYPQSQLCDFRLDRPLEIDSTKDLSRAQAMALIDALFGHPQRGLTKDTPLTQEAHWFLKELALRVRRERAAAQAAFVGALVPAEA